MLAHHVEDRPLDRIGVICGSVALGQIRSLGDIDNRVSRRVGDVRAFIECGPDDGDIRCE